VDFMTVVRQFFVRDQSAITLLPVALAANEFF